MALNVGSEINDCYMFGIGELENIGNHGRIEAAGKDWTIIRDEELDKVIFTNRNLSELEDFLTN